MNEITSKKTAEGIINSLSQVADICASEVWNKRVMSAINQPEVNRKQISKGSSSLLVLLIVANTIICSLAIVQNHNYGKSVQRNVELERAGNELRLTDINL